MPYLRCSAYSLLDYYLQLCFWLIPFSIECLLYLVVKTSRPSTTSPKNCLLASSSLCLTLSRDVSRITSGFFLVFISYNYQWIFLIIYINTRGFSAYYTTVGGALLFILTIHTICQPYIKRVHNIIDTRLFANLVLINSLSFFNYYRTRGQRDIEEGTTVLPATMQLVLIYLPMVVMCVYLIMILCKNVEKCGWKKPFVNNAAFLMPGRKNRLRELIRTIIISVVPWILVMRSLLTIDLWMRILPTQVDT